MNDIFKKCFYQKLIFSDRRMFCERVSEQIMVDPDSFNKHQHREQYSFSKQKIFAFWMHVIPSEITETT